MSIYLLASLVIIAALILAWVIVKLIQTLAKLPLKVVCSKLCGIVIGGAAGSFITYMLIEGTIEIIKKAPSNPTFSMAVFTVITVALFAAAVIGFAVGTLILVISFFLDDSWKSDQRYFDIVKKYYLKR